ncbi:DUF1376 domain-containing protein [Paenirhodobacter populi]|uniref:DUF1376 domain-containing protein n=1 Tax=Paenirhodobacter populi TaxID=2306993 RepID=UPI000FE3F201|nr:DUF1376 domain-containing protein [Sinirhodobacter populi]RWR09788.1 DUF1376 domain-containing protein [Sinirhodobacter populi]
MSEFYKFEIANWNEGTANLTLEQEAAYLRIVNAIRLSDQPITFNMFVLCGLWRCNERKAKRILQELVDAGKVHIEDGKIVNEKAVEAASNLRRLRAERASAGSRGGVESGKARSKCLENKDTSEAIASTREEKKREDITPHPPKGSVTRFDEFWSAYPHRGGAKKNRKVAEEKYHRAVKAGNAEQEIIDGAKRYAHDRGVLDGYAKDPATWLNQSCWQDEIEPAKPKVVDGGKMSATPTIGEERTYPDGVTKKYLGVGPGWVVCHY